MEIYNENKTLIAGGKDFYIMCETYDKDKVNYLLDNKETIVKKYCTEDWYFKKLTYDIKEFKSTGTMTINYEKSKNDDSSIYYSRWYGRGAQQMTGEIRKFLQGNEYLDIDIVNSAPSIILGITNKYNIENKYLTRYVNNRKKIIEKYYGGVKENVKDFIKFCLFSDKPFSKNKIKFELNMIDEMKNIKIQLSEHDNFKTIFEHNKTDLKKTNPYGSFLSDVYSIYETNIIWKAIKFYEQKTNDHANVQQHDGFQAKDNEKFKIVNLNKYITEEMGFNIVFCTKSNESEIKMDEVKEIKVIDTDKEDDKKEVKEIKDKDELKTFEIVAKSFEEKHCKIINKAIFVKECGEGHVILSKAQIKTSYENIIFEIKTKKDIKAQNFINKWLINNPKQRCYEDLGTYPPPLIAPSNMFNIWQPFAMERIKDFEKKENELNTILQHIKILCGNEQHVYDYFIKWIAQMIQYPAVKTICPTLISKQGAGKGTLLKLFAKMLGDNKVFETTDPSRDVWGAFNGKMCDTFLVNLNELSKKDTNDSAGKIKGLITDAKLSINNKNVNQYEINSYHRFLITTNNPEPINTSADDRRNLIIRSSDELIKNKEYFNKLHVLLDDINVVKTCYDYFKSVEGMDKFNSLPIPETEHQNNLKQLSITPIEQWLEAFTIEHHKKESVELLGVETCNLFKTWCKSNGMNYDIDARKLGVRMKNLKIVGIEKGRHTNKGETKKFDINKLKKHFKIGCLIDYEDVQQDTDNEEEEDQLTDEEE